MPAVSFGFGAPASGAWFSGSRRRAHETLEFLEHALRHEGDVTLPPKIFRMRVNRRRYAHTYGDYLMLEAEASTVRHEFIDGEIVAIAGGSDLHSALIAALSGELYTQ